MTIWDDETILFYYQISLFLVYMQEAPSIDEVHATTMLYKTLFNLYIHIYLNKWFQQFAASTVEYTAKLWLLLRVLITDRQRTFNWNETIWTTTAIGVFCLQITSALTPINVIGCLFSSDRSNFSSEFQAYKSRIKQRLYTPEEFLKLRQCTWNLGENN